MFDIEKVFRVHIEFNPNTIEKHSAIENKAFHYGSNLLNLEIYNGSPACPPYIQAESYNLEELKEFADKIYRYIKKRKAN